MQEQEQNDQPSPPHNDPFRTRSRCRMHASCWTHAISQLIQTTNRQVIKSISLPPDSKVHFAVTVHTVITSYRAHSQIISLNAQYPTHNITQDFGLRRSAGKQLGKIIVATTAWKQTMINNSSLLINDDQIGGKSIVTSRHWKRKNFESIRPSTCLTCCLGLQLH